jgi:hypothetical protein
VCAGRHLTHVNLVWQTGEEMRARLSNMCARIHSHTSERAHVALRNGRRHDEGGPRRLLPTDARNEEAASVSKGELAFLHAEQECSKQMSS